MVEEAAIFKNDHQLFQRGNFARVVTIRLLDLIVDIEQIAMQGE